MKNKEDLPSDWALFEMFRESSGFDEKYSWELVEEAKKAYREFHRKQVLEEIEAEGLERRNDLSYNLYAA